MPSSVVSGTERLRVSDHRLQGVYTRHDLVQHLSNEEDFQRNQAISNQLAKQFWFFFLILILFRDFDRQPRNRTVGHNYKQASGSGGTHSRTGGRGREGEGGGEAGVRAWG